MNVMSVTAHECKSVCRAVSAVIVATNMNEFVCRAMMNAVIVTTHMNVNLFVGAITAVDVTTHINASLFAGLG